MRLKFRRNPFLHRACKGTRPRANDPEPGAKAPNLIASLRSQKRALFKKNNAIPPPPQETPPAMSLTILPNELILIIANYLRPKALNSLLQTCRRFTILLTPLLHKLALNDHNGVPSLILAAEGGYEPLVRLLLQRGADIECQSYRRHGKSEHYGEATPLLQAVAFDHGEVVKLLLENGANVKTHPYSEDLLLRVAESEAVTRMLLKHGLRIKRVEDIRWLSRDGCSRNVNRCWRNCKSCVS